MEKRFISLDEKACRVPLQNFQGHRSKEEIEKEREEAYNRRNSFINPFVSKLDVIKNNLDYIYIYLVFEDYLATDNVQKCIKAIAGEAEYNIVMVSEDEQDVILKVESKKINTNAFKWEGKFKLFFNVLRAAPRILNAASYTDAFKELGKDFKDDVTCTDIIIVLRNCNASESNFEDLKSFDFLDKLRLVKELGVIFGKISKPEKISFLRELKYVACTYLRNMEDISPYDSTKGKTKEKITVDYSEKELKHKPCVCVVDCGISDALFVKSEKKLSYLTNELLDHGTQVASLVVAADDLLRGQKLVQKYPLYSYKISDGKKENILEGLVNAINEFHVQCKLFVMSYNFYEKLEPVLIHHLSRRLDNFIHQKDVIVITSTGNNSDVTIKDAVDRNYLNKNPMLFPSNCKNIFSTGGLLEYASPLRIIAPYTRYLPYLPDLETKGEEYFILKPNIYTYGGGIDRNKKQHLVPSVSADKFLVKSTGTSFANGILGHFFLKLLEEYPSVRFSETYKALMLASGQLEYLDDRQEAGAKITINSLDDFKVENKAIILYNEHKDSLQKYRPGSFARKLSQSAEELKFYVNAEKIEKIQIFLVHSNNYIRNPYSKSLLYFNVGLFEPKEDAVTLKNSMFGDRSEWSTFGKCTPVQIAEYKLGKKNKKIETQNGEWTLKAIPRRKNIPYAEDNITIRWCMVIKLIPRKNFIDRIDEIYEEILEKTKGITPQKPEVLSKKIETKQEA